MTDEPSAAYDFVDNAGVQLCIERRGAGAEHLLFAHGWISSRRMWYDVVERLNPTRFTVHLLDFRGCGASDRPMQGHDLEGYASDLRAALAAIERPVTIVAHSMGGKIAQYVAAERPEHLARLILVAPGTARGQRVSQRHRALALDAYGNRRNIEAFQRAAMAREIPRERLLRIIDDALADQREAWLGWYDHGRSLDMSERLERVAVPAIAVAGENDPLVPPSRVKNEVSAAIAGCRFIMLRNAGHNLPVETPDEVAGVIERFTGAATA